MEREAEHGGISVRNDQVDRDLKEGLLKALARCGSRTLALIQERDLARAHPPGRVGVVLVNDREISRVHGEFLKDPSPTDVITFPYGDYGEILISVDTAARQAGEFQVPLEREIGLYLVHGLLHLCGYDDHDEVQRDEMTKLQENLLNEAFDGP